MISFCLCFVSPFAKVCHFRSLRALSLVGSGPPVPGTALEIVVRAHTLDPAEEHFFNPLRVGDGIILSQPLECGFRSQAPNVRLSRLIPGEAFASVGQPRPCRHLGALRCCSPAGPLP